MYSSDEIAHSFAEALSVRTRRVAPELAVISGPRDRVEYSAQEGSEGQKWLDAQFKCPRCGANKSVRCGQHRGTTNERQRRRCKACGRYFQEAYTHGQIKKPKVRLGRPTRLTQQHRINLMKAWIRRREAKGE